MTLQDTLEISAIKLTFIYHKSKYKCELIKALNLIISVIDDLTDLDYINTTLYKSDFTHNDFIDIKLEANEIIELLNRSECALLVIKKKLKKRYPEYRVIERGISNIREIKDILALLFLID